MFIVCSYLSGSIGIVRKNVTKDAVMVCICIITHTIFFIIIAPVSHYRGTPRFWAFFGLFFLWVGGEGRTDCRRGGCMVVPGAVVSPAVRPVRWRETKKASWREIKKASRL